MYRAIAFVLACAVLTMAGPADAFRRGHDHNAQSAQNVTVTRDQAIEIARQRGMTRLHEVKFDKGVWEVEGWTATGDKIEFDIHPQTGMILKEEIYRSRR